MPPKRPTLRETQTGPSREVRRAVATAKNILRNQDIRAIAFVAVMPNGEVGSFYSGHQDGLFHQLNSGIATLRARFDRET